MKQKYFKLIGSGLLSISTAALLTGCGSSNVKQPKAKVSSSSESSSSVSMPSYNSNNYQMPNSSSHKDTSHHKDSDDEDIHHVARAPKTKVSKAKPVKHAMPSSISKLRNQFDSKFSFAEQQEGHKQLGSKKHPDNDKSRAVIFANDYYIAQGINKNPTDLATIKKDLLTGNSRFTKSAAEYAIAHISPDAKKINRYYQTHKSAVKDSLKGSVNQF